MNQLIQMCYGVAGVLVIFGFAYLLACVTEKKKKKFETKKN